MRRTLLPLAATLAALTAIATACGDDSNTASIAAPRPPAPEDGGSAQIVDVAMEDIRFSETSMAVTTGTTVRFRFDNVGKIAHDAFVGDLEAQMDHEAEMAQMSGIADASHAGNTQGDAHSDSHGADEPALVLQPGETGELSYTFDQPGTYEIGCHQPGHYAAGMKMEITVS
jgi:uncharacterized cupredoxin-like copper-binding protein